jgi:hypothetical protein
MYTTVGTGRGMGWKSNQGNRQSSKENNKYQYNNWWGPLMVAQ